MKKMTYEDVIRTPVWRRVMLPYVAPSLSIFWR